jgi:hypothetical protein
LIALRGVGEDPAERRKRAAKHGRIALEALDGLDELKIGLSAARFSASTLTNLRAAAAQIKLGSGNPSSTKCWARSSFAWRSRSPRWRARRSSTYEAVGARHTAIACDLPVAKIVWG